MGYMINSRITQGHTPKMRINKLNQSELQNYLDKHFISRSQLKQILGVRNDELIELISKGMIPAWSYKIENGYSYTHVFGQSPVSKCRNGEYFSPFVIDWYNDNLTLFPDHQTTNNLEEKLRSKFIESYIAEAYTNESFKNYLKEVIDNFQTIQEYANNSWQHHLEGTYGVCVNKPSCVARIIKKQVAVVALSKITNNGVKRSYTEKELTELHKCIEEYNKVAMPFSPVDYEKSSRRRLVVSVLENLVAFNDNPPRPKT